jgi:hypothetical protein
MLGLPPLPLRLHPLTLRGRGGTGSPKTALAAALQALLGMLVIVKIQRALKVYLLQAIFDDFSADVRADSARYLLTSMTTRAIPRLWECIVLLRYQVLYSVLVVSLINFLRICLC